MALTSLNVYTTSHPLRETSVYVSRHGLPVWALEVVIPFAHWKVSLRCPSTGCRQTQTTQCNGLDLILMRLTPRVRGHFLAPASNAYVSSCLVCKTPPLTSLFSFTGENHIPSSQFGKKKKKKKKKKNSNNSGLSNCPSHRKCKFYDHFMLGSRKWDIGKEYRERGVWFGYTLFACMMFSWKIKRNKKAHPASLKW